MSDFRNRVTLQPHDHDGILFPTGGSGQPVQEQFGVQFLKGLWRLVLLPIPPFTLSMTFFCPTGSYDALPHGPPCDSRKVIAPQMLFCEVSLDRPQIAHSGSAVAIHIQGPLL